MVEPLAVTQPQGSSILSACTRGKVGLARLEPTLKALVPVDNLVSSLKAEHSPLVSPIAGGSVREDRMPQKGSQIGRKPSGSGATVAYLVRNQAVGGAAPPYLTKSFRFNYIG